MSTPHAPSASAQQGSNAGATGKGKRGQPRKVQKFPEEEFQLLRPATVEERAVYKRHREARTEQQKAVDSMVWGIYEDWKNSGMPRKFVDIPIGVWPVSPNLEEDARHMLQKAAVLFQRTLRYGDCPTIEKDGKKKVHLAFYVVDRLTEIEGAPSGS